MLFVLRKNKIDKIKVKINKGIRFPERIMPVKKIINKIEFSIKTLFLFLFKKIGIRKKENNENL